MIKLKDNPILSKGVLKHPNGVVDFFNDETLRNTIEKNIETVINDNPSSVFIYGSKIDPEYIRKVLAKLMSNILIQICSYQSLKKVYENKDKGNVKRKSAFHRSAYKKTSKVNIDDLIEIISRYRNDICELYQNSNGTQPYYDELLYENDTISLNLHKFDVISQGLFQKCVDNIIKLIVKKFPTHIDIK